MKIVEITNDVTLEARDKVRVSGRQINRSQQLFLSLH
jgi:hypothetical protein